MSVMSMSYSQSERRKELREKFESMKDLELCKEILNAGMKIDEYFDGKFEVFKMALNASLKYNGNLTDRQRPILESTLVNYYEAWDLWY